MEPTRKSKGTDMAKSQQATAALEAKHGDKMIEVKLRFWTNDIADEPGKVIPKHAWDSGVVRIERNDSHGIVPSNPIPFDSLLHVGAVIEGVLIEHHIKLHSSHKPRKYMYNP
jgi:hypothetical protein